MKRTSLIVAGLLLVTGLTGTGCKRKNSKIDGAFQHTPENTYRKIEEVRLQLTEAAEKKNLQYVHDNMYYFEGLLKGLSATLEGEQKQRVDGVINDLRNLAAAIDNSAGRGNQAATEANLQKLTETLQELETEFKQAKK